MGGPSFEARRPKSKAQVGEYCPECKTGILVQVDENFITCDSCGFDIPIKEAKEKDNESA